MIKNSLKLMFTGIAVVCVCGSNDLKVASADPATQTTRPVVVFGTQGTDDPIVVGESTLTRTDSGITMHLTAKGLPAGAYSGWIPIFGPNGPIAAGRVAGHVIGNGGELTFVAHLKVGEEISGHPIFPAGAVADPRGQDIGMVVRYHGEPDPEFLYEQTHTYEDGVAEDALFTRHNAP